MTVEIRVEGKFSRRVGRTNLVRTAEKTLQAERVAKDRELTIIIVSDDAIRSLNKQFHRVDATTDVLSFHGDSDHYLGDIVISFETARENARAARWTIQEELMLLTVHGILHLLGYDDTRPRARAKLWRRQAIILGRTIPETR